MRAMVLEQPAPIESHPLQARDVPTPTPGPGQILIRVHACGLCRTDLHEIEGELPLPKRPLIPGHQVVGHVAACGPGAGGRLREGDRVGLFWLHEACGRCALYHAKNRPRSR